MTVPKTNLNDTQKRKLQEQPSEQPAPVTEAATATATVEEIPKLNALDAQINLAAQQTATRIDALTDSRSTFIEQAVPIVQRLVNPDELWLQILQQAIEVQPNEIPLGKPLPLSGCTFPTLTGGVNRLALPGSSA